MNKVPIEVLLILPLMHALLVLPGLLGILWLLGLLGTHVSLAHPAVLTSTSSRVDILVLALLRIRLLGLLGSVRILIATRAFAIREAVLLCFDGCLAFVTGQVMLLFIYLLEVTIRMCADWLFGCSVFALAARLADTIVKGVCAINRDRAFFIRRQCGAGQQTETHHQCDEQRKSAFAQTEIVVHVILPFFAIFVGCKVSGGWAGMVRPSSAPQGPICRVFAVDSGAAYFSSLALRAALSGRVAKKLPAAGLT